MGKFRMISRQLRATTLSTRCSRNVVTGFKNRKRLAEESHLKILLSFTSATTLLNNLLKKNKLQLMLLKKVVTKKVKKLKRRKKKKAKVKKVLAMTLVALKKLPCSVLQNALANLMSFTLI